MKDEEVKLEEIEVSLTLGGVCHIHGNTSDISLVTHDKARAK